MIIVLMVNKTNLVECRAVIDFLDTFNSSGTISSYKSYLNNYFKWLNIKPDEYIKSKRESRHVQACLQQFLRVSKSGESRPKVFAQLVNVLRRCICQVALALSPNVLIRVEFRGIRGEPVHVESTLPAGKVLRHDPPAMNRPTVPQQHDGSVKVPL